MALTKKCCCDRDCPYTLNQHYTGCPCYDVADPIARARDLLAEQIHFGGENAGALKPLLAEIDQLRAPGLSGPTDRLLVARLYLECHITCDAHPSLPFEHFADVARIMHWRASRFSEDEVDDYHGKWFLSYRHKALPQAKLQVLIMRDHLRKNGFNVLRWKIEDTLLDSKYGDEL